MKHELKKLANSAVEIKISLTAEEVNPIKDEVTKEIAKKVEIPGFRKGHAPVSAVEAQYKENIKEEVAEKVLQKYYEEVIKAENIVPVSYISNLNVKLEDGFEATFNVDVYPEVKLGEYKGLEVEKETFEMTPEKLDKEIEIMLNSKSKLEDTEEGYKAQMGDTVDLAFEGFMDGVPFEGGKADSHMLKLGSHMFIDNFEDQLVGYTAGQEGEITVNFPEEYHAANLAGKPAVFKVKVNAIKKLSIPELTDELAKEFGAESVEDLKAKTTERVTKREEERVKNQHVARLIDKLAETTEVEVPVSMIAGEVRARIADMEQQFAAQGIKLDMYLQMTGMDLNQLQSQIAPMAAQKVKADLMLAAIIKAENLDATEEEVTEKMTELAKMYGMDFAQLKENLEKSKNFENFKLSVKEECLMQKAIEVLVKNAKDAKPADNLLAKDAE